MHGIIIFSRLSSERLPNKALVDIGGRTLLQRVIDRAKLILPLSQIVVATSDGRDDQALADHALGEGVEVFRGSLNNVAERARDCARYYAFDYFARVCGDRTFFDPLETKECFRIIEETSVDIVTNAFEGGCSPGQTTEIIKFSAIEKVVASALESECKEHMTRYIYNNPTDFKIRNYVSVSKGSTLPLAVDTYEDVERARYIVDNAGKDPRYLTFSEISNLANAFKAH